MHKSEIMEKTCFACHSTPDAAPKGLLQTYGTKRGFGGRHEGEIVSVMSVRVPLSSIISSGIRSFIDLCFLLLGISALSILAIVMITNRALINPIKNIEKRVKRISDNERILYEEIPLEGGREFKSLISSVNAMGKELRNKNKQMEEEVRVRTQDLSIANEKLNTENEKHKKTQEEMQASETRYRRLFESAKDGILILDAETGLIIDVNPFLIELLGYSHEAFSKKAIWELGFFKDIVANKDNFEELQSNEYIRYEDKPLETADGRRIDVEFVSNVYLVNDSKVIQCNIRDITNRKKAEEAVKESNKQFQIIFDSSNDAIIIGEPYGAFLEVNKYACERYGYSREEFLNMSPMDLDLPEQASQIPQRTQRILVDGKALFETVHRTKNGEMLNVEIISRSISYKGKSAILSNIRDITDRRETEAKKQMLQNQEKYAVVGKVAGKMAHDFNNVLAVIMGTSQLLQDEDLPPEVKADIDTILESAERGVALTKNLLLFAKDQEAKLSQIDINEKIELVIKALKSELKDIEVSLTYGSSMEKLLADAGLLENAIINLIQNSIHALGKIEKPVLSIRTYEKNDNICIVIEDNGCGIPAEHLDKIFEPTFTLKGGEDRIGAYNYGIKGSGYGLANVKQCVDKHGGTISIESEVGKGAKFEIMLPLIKGYFSTEEMGKIREHKIVKGKRILIVEDEIHLSRILYSALQKFEHEIDLATDGKMALDYIKRNVYDVISLDYMLPNTNGLEIYRKIRETNKSVPVVFVSGNFEFMQSMIDLKKEDKKVDHLAKPFNNVDYVNKIHDWLEE
jgi:PAS domain S-box-containing protein